MICGGFEAEHQQSEAYAPADELIKETLNFEDRMLAVSNMKE